MRWDMIGEFFFWIGATCTTVGLAMYDTRIALVAGGTVAVCVGVLLMIGSGNARNRD